MANHGGHMPRGQGSRPAPLLYGQVLHQMPRTPNDLLLPSVCTLCALTSLNIPGRRLSGLGSLLLARTLGKQQSPGGLPFMPSEQPTNDPYQQWRYRCRPRLLGAGAETHSPGALPGQNSVAALGAGIQLKGRQEAWVRPLGNKQARFSGPA